MKTKMLAAVVFFMAAPLIVPIAAGASVLETWNFYSIAADGTFLTSPQTPGSTPGGYTITLTAIENYTTGALGYFYDRNLGAGTDEQGLGVVPSSTSTGTNGGTDEVDSFNTPEAIQVDLPGGVGLYDFHLLFNSLADTETADIWVNGPSVAKGGTLLGTITHNGNISIPESFLIPNADIGSPIFVTASAKDFLLYGADATNPAPEPNTMLLFGAGLAGLGGMMWRRKTGRGWME